MAKHTYVMDAGTAAKLATPGFDAGFTVSFNDGLPTIDDGVAFAISQLAKVEAKTYEAQYTHITFMDDVPLMSDVPEWADSVDYISYDGVTLGKFIGASADDLPNIDVNATKSSFPIGYAGNQYSYSLDELRKSQQMNMPIDATKARKAFRGAQEHSQRVAYFGDTERGMTGLFNNGNVPLDSSSVVWSTATGAEIAADVNDLLTTVWTNSANVHIPGTLLLPSARYALINSKQHAAGTDTTVLNFIKQNNLFTAMTGQELEVKPRLQLKGAATGGTNDRMMAYEKNEDNLTMAMPIPFRPLAPQADGLKIKVPCEYKVSGVEFRYPFAAGYRDFGDTI